MYPKVLIIGKNSFIGKNFFNLSKNKKFKKIYSYKKFLKIKKKNLIKFDVIINFSIKMNYVNKKYSLLNDIDYKIATRIKDLNILYVFISSRKVYKNGENLEENSRKKPHDNYSKNKLITEKKLKKILFKNLLILRLSNVVGIKKITRNSIHKTFIDYYFENIKKGQIINSNNEFKDFLGIKQLTLILNQIIEKKINGIYNVSLGKKVYLKEIIGWLNTYNHSKLRYIKLHKSQNNDSFTLKNAKLVKAINCKIYKKDLEKECKIISKLHFKNKK